MNLNFYAVTIDRWTDFEQLFESKGGPHYCWRTVWRLNENKNSIPGKAGKKASMYNRVIRGIQIGILAYLESESIGWCSIAPREPKRKLGGDETKEGVWSLVCFFIKKPFSSKGITSRLIDAAIEYANDNGAKYIEAYPVAPDSPSYGFMGFVPTFEKAGFKFVKTAGTRRNVMIFSI